MKMTNYFDLSRFWLLLKTELLRSKKGVLMTFLIVFDMLFFVGFLLDVILDGNKVSYEHHENFAFTLITGGFVLSSLAFSDLSSSLKTYKYLTLPVSTLEKFLSMWLLTSLGWILLFTTTFTLYTLIVNLIGGMVFSHVNFQVFEPTSSFSIAVIQYYFVLQGIFLVGATHFKGYVFPKTLFVIVVTAVAFGIIAYLVMSDVINAETEACLSEANYLVDKPIYKLWIVLQGLFWWAFAPLCWLITYFGLKDREA